MLHPVVCNPVMTPVVNVFNVPAWRAGGAFPRLPAGHYYLTDENGEYLTDEQGNYLTGSLT
jgi:hypothetical protein